MISKAKGVQAVRGAGNIASGIAGLPGKAWSSFKDMLPSAPDLDWRSALVGK